MVAWLNVDRCCFLFLSVGLQWTGHHCRASSTAPPRSYLRGGWKQYPLDVGNVEIVDGVHARAGRLALNARMTDSRAVQLLTIIPEGEFTLKLKFLRHQNKGAWVVEDKFDRPAGPC